MNRIDAIREQIPDAARDLKINLSTVLGEGSLTEAQKWGTAVACALAARNEPLARAILAEATERVDPAVVDDARAAAALMAMNNVYYRFRHMIGKESYSQLPARLRMQRIARPLGSKVDFELFCLAVSAINGCEACMRSHEKVVIDGGLSEAQVHDAIRIAAAIHGAAVALELYPDQVQTLAA